jgi:hypothetical protein
MAIGVVAAFMPVSMFIHDDHAVAIVVVVVMIASAGARTPD